VRGWSRDEVRFLFQHAEDFSPTDEDAGEGSD
jgi:hypothetical protein